MIAALSIPLGLIWAIGFVQMWRKQSASRDSVPVGISDRAMAIAWPLLYLMIPIGIVHRSFRNYGQDPLNRLR